MVMEFIDSQDMLVPILLMQDKEEPLPDGNGSS